MFPDEDTLKISRFHSNCEGYLPWLILPTVIATLRTVFTYKKAYIDSFLKIPLKRWKNTLRISVLLLLYEIPTNQLFHWIPLAQCFPEEGFLLFIEYLTFNLSLTSRQYPLVKGLLFSPLKDRLNHKFPMKKWHKTCLDYYFSRSTMIMKKG